MAEKLYVIYDERALTMPTDDAAVLQACESLRDVRRTSWDGTRDPLGVVAEYDVATGNELVNERIIGTVPELKRQAKEPTR